MQAIERKIKFWYHGALIEVTSEDLGFAVGAERLDNSRRIWHEIAARLKAAGFKDVEVISRDAGLWEPEVETVQRPRGLPDTCVSCNQPRTYEPCDGGVRAVCGTSACARNGEIILLEGET